MVTVVVEIPAYDEEVMCGKLLANVERGTVYDGRVLTVVGKTGMLTSVDDGIPSGRPGKRESGYVCAWR